jgi:two-component system, chemotaxis family, protein-glutamate methylesterase/glutaminase
MRDIVVVGASAGGIQALKRLAAGLPEDFPASMFIVLHMASDRTSILPQILSKETKLPVTFAQEKEPIRAGHIFIAPPNYHLLIEQDHMHLASGPREHFSRPAINPLFRSAAHAYGGRVIGVILSGRLDDGVAGLWEIKRRGGLAVVQDPAEAEHPSMPASALENVEVDYTVEIGAMPPLLSRLVMEDGQMEQKTMEAGQAQEGDPVDLTCPDCRGGLREYHFGKVVEYRCRVGHAHSPLSMIWNHREAQERALWAALVALEEGATLSTHLAGSLGKEAYAREAEDKARHAETLKALIMSIKDFNPPGQAA